MEQEERKRIISLICREVVPAIGCTEPMAVSLCVARAAETLGVRPQKIEVLLSANILKNAMGVGIPGTGMIGLPISIALGALIGKSAYQLEVLKECTPQAVEEGKQFIAENRISIALKEGITEKLYIEVCCRAGADEAVAVIAGGHTHFVKVVRNGEIVMQEGCGGPCSEESEPSLTLRKVYEFATQSPLDEISFILKTKDINEKAAQYAVSSGGSFGLDLGKTIRMPLEQSVLGDSIYSRILSQTACACDVRMGGAMVPVMSNSGSGNQGICATMPVSVFAREHGNSEEELVRALTLSHLTAIYIKQSLGKLSALCGCVVASTGSSCGITYLMGGNYNQISYAVKNMIANLTGMICDGAKPSCALKLASGVSTAILSAMLAMQNKCVTSLEGIIDDDVDESIRNLTVIGRDGMQETDKMVLGIMTHKKCNRQ